MSDCVSVAVAKKLHAVMADVNYIKRDKKNEFHKYTYASEKAIKETLHPILVKHGLLFVPVSCEIISDVEIESKDKEGKPKPKERLLTVRYIYRFIDPETGEYIDVQSIGSGIDNQDKAAYKSQTGAAKYALTSTFLIPTGDDPENEKEKRGSRVAQDAVVERKTGRAPEGWTEISRPAPADEQQGGASKPQAVPKGTSKLFEALKAFGDIKKGLGEKTYYRILLANGYHKSNEITDEAKARSIYKLMAMAKKAKDAAAHGEIILGMDKALFKELPDVSVAAIMREFQKKFAAAFGTEVGPQEYDALRATSVTSWDFCNKMNQALDEYQQQVGA